MPPESGKTKRTNFNPRSSCEERLRVRDTLLDAVNFNPRSSCEERLGGSVDASLFAISIHAPHARSDRMDFCTS